MKKCPFCDTENEDSAKECVICGTELPAAATTATSSTPSLSIDGGATSTAGGGYTVVITNIGANKIVVIKEIKDFLNCGLEDAKKKCEGRVVAQGMAQGDADLLISKLQSAGASAQACEDSKVQMQVNTTQQTITVTNKIKIALVIAIGIMAFISFLLSLFV